MGLISAGIGAVGGTLADQWLDFLTAPAFDEQTLVASAVRQERKNGRGANKCGSTTIVTDGTRVAVPENTAVIISDGGGILSVSTEPGYFVFRNDGQPSIFTAIQEQLGMKLQREEITRDAFVVERVSPPTPN